ncbi:pseudouridine synthase [Flavihumibacter petaseus]|uniref:Pseudouridine synthase n=1 Tax=Flavihumibacter petaseus NBRC 106054 TaxID=1220578 RepID=A0A0E9MZ38_9BACT|nr:pseudouridine synthase [Flavihumibacter petaseus]GAO42864.1 23S rRNA pseudouridine synthase RluE [Flavihumibacter petaseus NBRC 106054]
MFSYYVLYKPYEVLTQFSAVSGKRCLQDILKVPSDVYPVGRLDYDSEGLLLLTNDAGMNAALLHPRREHYRTYYVQVEGSPDDESLARLSAGVTISVDGRKHHTRPAIAQRLPADPSLPERVPAIRFRKNIPATWISLQLTEGKNRQVRRMTAAVGYPTLRLVRYAIGDLTIEGFASGEYRKFTPGQLRELLFRKK